MDIWRVSNGSLLTCGILPRCDWSRHTSNIKTLPVVLKSINSTEIEIVKCSEVKPKSRCSMPQFCCYFGVSYPRAIAAAATISNSDVKTADGVAILHKKETQIKNIVNS